MSARRYPGVERRLRDASRAALAAGVMTLLLPMGPSSAADVQFTDITQAAGVDFKHESSATPSKYLLETMGGGVAMLDVDNDGRLDLFFTNGARIDDPQPPGKRPDKSEPRFWNRMYRQKEDGTFVDVTEKAGLSGAGDGTYGMGVAVGDYDNDGFEDLYVTSYGGNRLYRNTGNGAFADVTGARRRRCRRLERERRVLRLRQRRQARSVRHPLSLMDLPEQPPLRGEKARLPRLLSPGQFRRCDEHPLSQQRERHVHRRLREGGYR